MTEKQLVYAKVLQEKLKTYEPIIDTERKNLANCIINQYTDPVL